MSHLLRVHPSLHNNEFTVHPLAEDIGVHANGTDVIQILLNLTVNAFQSSPHGCQVEINGEIYRRPLDLASFKDSPYDRLLNIENFDNTAPLARLSVRDTGSGIPPEVLPKIFQPYFTTKGPRQGTGLGLNIVQRLVKEARGALHVHTHLGEGTTFSIFLPAAPLAK
jgi:signal transduction histidine kinase